MMSKEHFMEVYTIEQLADLLVLLNQDNNRAIDEVAELKVKLDRKQNEINQIDEILEELFNIKHDDMGSLDEFKNYLTKLLEQNSFDMDKQISETAKYKEAFESTKKERDFQVCKLQNEIAKLKNRSVVDFLPNEPIKVADMLIYASNEYEQTLTVGDMKKTDNGTYRIFSIEDLQQIAQHLLVYCNSHLEEES